MGSADLTNQCSHQLQFPHSADFMKIAKDKETGHIYYEDYINLLMNFNSQ